MPGAGHEHDAALLPHARRGEVTGQGDKNRQAIAVVPGSIEPGVGVGVEHDVLIAP